MMIIMITMFEVGVERKWFVDNILTITTYVTMFGVEVDEEMVCENVLCGDCSGEQGEEKEQREMR